VSKAFIINILALKRHIKSFAMIPRSGESFWLCTIIAKMRIQLLVSCNIMKVYECSFVSPERSLSSFRNQVINARTLVQKST